MQHPTPHLLAALLLPLLLAACQADYAAEGAPGEPCLTDLDCDGLRCIAFTCVEPTSTHDPTPIPDAGLPDAPDVEDPPLGCAPSCRDANTRLLCFEGRPNPEPIPCAPQERCLAGACIPEEDRCLEGSHRCAQGRFVERCSGAGWVREEDCDVAGCLAEEAQCADDSSLPNLQARFIDGEVGVFRPGTPYALAMSFASTASAPIPDGITCQALLSRDGLPSAEDLLLSTFNAGLGAGESVTLEETTLLPLDLNPGSYRLLGVCDPEDRLAESNEGDNLVDAGPLIEIVPLEMACSTDPLEPNNDPSSPAQLMIPGRWEGLSVCRSDLDYYRVCLSESEEVEFTIDFRNAEADIDMTLYRGEQTLGASQSTTDQESIYDLLPPGCYVLNVFVFSEGLRADVTYDLTIRLNP